MSCCVLDHGQRIKDSPLVLLYSGVGGNATLLVTPRALQWRWSPYHVSYTLNITFLVSVKIKAVRNYESKYNRFCYDFLLISTSKIPGNQSQSVDPSSLHRLPFLCLCLHPSSHRILPPQIPYQVQTHSPHIFDVCFYNGVLQNR